MAQDITFDIIARDKASRTFDKIAGSSSKTQSKLVKFGKVAAGALASTGVVAVAAGVKFAKMAIDDEAAAAKLAKAMRNNAHATRGQIAATESWITAQGKAYGVADDDLRPALGKLVTATHNVTKAQRLASLAMNVSAGTGKSLESVSFALAKAQSGNVSGLARLGIATKDAAGKTKSLHDITRDLAKTYSGQAATAAHTAAGRFNRVKLELSEAAETIGYKLLPVADDLSKWLLHDAIPAVEKFGKQMQDGTGAGGEFVDVLKDTVSVGKSILSFFNGLPGPVKKYGAELLIASVAIGKVNSGLAGLTGGLSRYVTNLTTAETRQAKVAAGLQGLGAAARNAAGAGGLVLLADSADEAGTKVGALKGIAGGALSGAALGAFAGPPGAAVGAALGGLAGAAFLLGKDIHGAGKKTADTLPYFTEYAKTLDGASAATTKLTRELAYERLEKSGLLAKTEKLGIADRDAVQAALGNAAARKRVSAALAEAVRHGKNYEALDIANRLGAETTALESSRVEQLKKNLALAKTDEQAAKIQAKLDRLGKTNTAPRISLPGAEKTDSKLTAIDKLITDIGGKRPNPTVNANTGPANAKLTALEDRLQHLASKTYTAAVNILTFSSSGGKVGHNARGTSNWRGGMTWVGEEGPELVNLPRGSQVYPATQSSSMTASAGDHVVVGVLEVIHKTPGGKVLEKELVELRNLRGGKPLAFQ